MTTSELSGHFKLFDLSEDATIDDLDEQYAQLTKEALEHRTELPQWSMAREKQLDASYAVLLHEYIRRACQCGETRRNPQMTFDRVKHRQYELGVQAQQLGEDEFAVIRRQYQSALLNTSKDKAKFRAEEEDEGDDSDEYFVANSRKFRIQEVEGDIFDALEGSVIVHAVNCLGVWGSGFAAALKIRFPAAFQVYANMCRQANPPDLLAGNALLIPPQAADYRGRGKCQRQFWVACLFTSVGYGSPSRHSIEPNPGKDDEDTIIMHTDAALSHLRAELTNLRARDLSDDDSPGQLVSPKFNSGSFGVDWRHTRKVLRMCFAGYDGIWSIVTPSEDDDDENDMC